MVKAISDTLKQIGPSTFVNFTRPNKGLIILPAFAPDDFQALAKRTVLLYQNCSHSLGLYLLHQI